MSRNLVFRTLVALALLLGTACSRAGESPLIGTWRLQSYVREMAGTGERYNQFGEHPAGYISYAPDGRMYVMLFSGERPHPSGVPTDAERIALHKSMLAYGGPYKVDGNKVVHHIEYAWDNGHLGTDQVRFFTINANTLTLKTEPNRALVDGREGIGILVFERVQEGTTK